MKERFTNRRMTTQAGMGIKKYTWGLYIIRRCYGIILYIHGRFDESRQVPMALKHLCPSRLSRFLRIQPKWLITIITVMLIGFSEWVAPPSLLAASTRDKSVSQQWSRLLNGTVLVTEHPASKSQALPAVEAKMLINLPVNQVWPVISDPEKAMQLETKVKKIQTLRHRGTEKDILYQVILSPLLPKFEYTLHYRTQAPDYIRFNRISGSFKDFEGFWKLTSVEQGQKTLVTYHLAIDPGFLAPQFILLQAVKNDLPTMMGHVRQAVKKELASNH
jgi:carbon monoxide dehydrogenase subunit G